MRFLTIANEFIGSVFRYLCKNKSLATSNLVCVVMLMVAVFTCSGERDACKIAKDQLQLEQQRQDRLRRAQILIDYTSSQVATCPTLRVSNVGDLDADSVWISESIYIVTLSDEVFECDLPRYAYLSVEGSARSMFTLESGADTSIEFCADCFEFFSAKFTDQFPGQLVAKWQVDFSQGNSPVRESVEDFFILRDNQARVIIRQGDFTGGFGLVEKIVQYQRYGNQRLLEWVHLTGSVVENPSRSFWQDSTGNWQALVPGQGVPVGTNLLFEAGFNKYDFSHSGPGCAAFQWSCDSSYTGKHLTASPSVVY